MFVSTRCPPRIPYLIIINESKDDKFKEGVQIIEEAYQPTMTRQFIRAEWKDEKGQWHIIPLSVTDADTDEEKAEEEAKKD